MPHLYLSNSSENLLRSCAHKFQLRKLYKHPRKSRSIYMEMGKALHIGLQSYLVHKDEDRAAFDYMVAYPIDMCENPMDLMSLEAGYATLQAMIASHTLGNREIAKIKCVDGEIRPAIEVPFEIVLDGYKLKYRGQEYTVSYVGYIDLILWNMQEDEYGVTDIKTTSKKQTKDATYQYAFNPQCTPYGLVLEYMKGTKINVFDVEFLHCNIDILMPNVQSYKFTRTKTDIEDWWRGLLINLSNIQMFMDMDWFPRNGNSCAWGNFVCEFFEICNIRERETLEKIILQEYQEDLGFELDEALYNKLMHREFQPWVKFAMEVPQ